MSESVTVRIFPDGTVQAEVHGPAVADLEHTFRERWRDPAPLDSRNPFRMLLDLRHGVHVRAQQPLPARRPDPPPATARPAAHTPGRR